MTIQVPNSPGLSSEIGVSSLSADEMDRSHLDFLRKSNLHTFGELESWVVKGSNSKINYSTHGVYRYFGKFPAPIAATLIEQYTNPGDLVIDPACGSGTTGVEARLSGRDAQLFDINPLSVLISKVKNHPLDLALTTNALNKVKSRFEKIDVAPFSTNEIDLSHWFLPETIRQLTNLKEAISLEKNVHIHEFLSMIFASIIRRASKATTQQGRLFLDVTTAVEDIWPLFEKSALVAATKISELPSSSSVTIHKHSLLDDVSLVAKKAPLVIYHPPYFNAYKYTSINSLEMAWLEFPRKETRQGEIREFFKVGKLSNAATYVSDMVQSLKTIHSLVETQGTVAMMIGDALMQGVHVDVTAQILNEINSIYEVEKTILRVPRYTEATWASSQRRKSGSLGITMYDFIIILRAK